MDCIFSKVLPKSIYNLYTQSFPPKPEWTTNDIPDLSNKTMIVTGATSGKLLTVNGDSYINT